MRTVILLLPLVRADTSGSFDLRRDESMGLSSETSFKTAAPTSSRLDAQIATLDNLLSKEKHRQKQQELPPATSFLEHTKRNFAQRRAAFDESWKRLQERGKQRLAKLHADIETPFMPSSLLEESRRPDETKFHEAGRREYPGDEIQKKWDHVEQFTNSHLANAEMNLDRLSQDAAPSSLVEEGAPDSFADLDAKLKALEEKTKAELAKLQSDTAAPSSFVEEGAPDSFADLDAKLKALEEKTKAELAKLQSDTAAPSSFAEGVGYNDLPEPSELKEQLDKLQASVDARAPPEGSGPMTTSELDRAFGGLNKKLQAQKEKLHNLVIDREVDEDHRRISNFEHERHVMDEASAKLRVAK